ncbi:MAG: hypothetical protein QF441_08600 [Bacteriovoracaceae bacterium]|jgi:3-phosphoshikimate 1-carboxyvinyltransferase|nr:hypothetical protein [Bacteriovoracaceae bacterium]
MTPNFIQLTSTNLPEIVSCPTSKSYANRYLIAAVLSKQEIELAKLPSSTDVTDLLKNLAEVGVHFRHKKETLTVVSSFPQCEKKQKEPILLSGSEGGTTIRFLCVLLALGQNKYVLPLKQRMAKRPMESLMEKIKELGGTVELKDSKLFIQGPISLEGRIVMDCSETTQFASALELCQASEDFSFELIAQNLSASKKYYLMTKHVVHQIKKSKFHVIPPDFSSLGYFVAYALFRQNILIQNVLEMDALQADSKIFEIVKAMGGKFSFTEKGLWIYRAENLSGFEVNGEECIDLVPTLFFMACLAKTPSTIFNIHLLRLKESDRLAGLLDILNYYGVEYCLENVKDQIKIFPLSEEKQSFWQKKQAILSPEFDHRMAMVSTLFLKALGHGKLMNFSSVNKSFPLFFDYFGK